MEQKSPFNKFGTEGKNKVQELKDVLEGKKEAHPHVAKEETAQTPDEGSQPALELQEKTTKLEEELKQQKDKSLRTLAEFENFRKRMEKEKEETIRYGNEKILLEMLPIIDHLEMTLDHARGLENEKKDPLIEGVEIVLKQFLQTLEKFGLKVVSGVGAPFDPHQHEAIGAIESGDHAAEEIVSVHRKGYMLQGRLIRPALVTIAKEPEEKENVGEPKQETIH